MKRGFLIFLCLNVIISFNGLLAKDDFLRIHWHLRFTITYPLYYPLDLTVAGDSLFVLDSKGQFALHVFNRNSANFIENLIPFGQGPGEVNQPQSIDNDGENIYILSSDFLLHSFPIRNPGNVNAAQVLKLPKSYWNFSAGASHLFIFRGFTQRYLLDLLRMENNRMKIFRKVIPFEHELSNCATNPLINQGPFAYDKEDQQVFVGFNYSSLIVSYDINKNSTNFIKRPNWIAIPSANSKSHHFEAPDAFKNTITYIDFGSDRKYLYAIYSGLKLRIWNFRKYKDRFDHGKVLRIFNNDSGRYLGSIKLPVWAQKILITPKAIFLLSNYPEPKILKYEKPNFEK